MEYLTCHTIYTLGIGLLFTVESCLLLGGCLSICITCMEIHSVPGGLYVVENCPLLGVSVSGDSTPDVQILK